MARITPRRLGSLIIVVSIIVLGLLVSMLQVNEDQRQRACAEMCDAEGLEQCGVAACPYHDKNPVTWLVWTASVLVAGIGGIGAYLLLLRSETVLEEKTYDLSDLSSEEKRTFEIIRKQGDIFQSKLAEELDVSKVRMTRILDSLERHELVERKRRGMTNIVVLR